MALTHQLRVARAAQAVAALLVIQVTLVAQPGLPIRGEAAVVERGLTTQRQQVAGLVALAL